jgi:sulfur-oxidizing protein SoxY
MKRRNLLQAAGALVVCTPAWATPDAMQAAITAWTGGVLPRDGRVQLEIAPLVENGNTVPVAVGVESAMNDQDRAVRLALFTERNPQPEVAVFELGPLAARARVEARMRLATSQTVVALAQMADGSFWQQRTQVVVTLAACVEGG